MEQLLFLWKGRRELLALIAALEARGYRNAGHLDGNYTFPVVVADRRRRIFFGTNTTCMAARASCGAPPPLPAAEVAARGVL